MACLCSQRCVPRAIHPPAESRSTNSPKCKVAFFLASIFCLSHWSIMPHTAVPSFSLSNLRTIFRAGILNPTADSAQKSSESHLATHECASLTRWHLYHEPLRACCCPGSARYCFVCVYKMGYQTCTGTLCLELDASGNIELEQAQATRQIYGDRSDCSGADCARNTSEATPGESMS